MSKALICGLSESVSLCRRLVLPISTVPVRLKAKNTAKFKRRERDAKDMSWVEPLREYEAEKAAQDAKGPQEPHMLHVVWRTRPLKGRPWWEKEIMTKFGLDDKKTYPVVLKNIPSVNLRLKEVKHLVKVRPLTFPHGFPQDPEDFEHAVLKTNGEYIVKKRVGAQSSSELEESDLRAKWRMEKETILKDCMERKVAYKIHQEYHKPIYEYKRNQDGKEYRYNFNKPGFKP